MSVTVRSGQENAGLPLLMVIDVQNGFLVPSSQHVVPAVARLIEWWLAAHAPVVLTRFLNDYGSPFERLVDYHAMRGSPDTNLAPELAGYADDDRVHVIDKTTYTALTAPVRELVTRSGVTQVYLCGIATEACVSLTAFSVFDAGLTPWVVTDACASNASGRCPEKVHTEAVRRLGHLIGANQLLDSEQAHAILTASVRRG
ncbi:isochorismatase family cysteine hydrolase [Nocardia sp. NPDC004260]